MVDPDDIGISEKELIARMQEMDEGFTYTVIDAGFKLQCNKCNRIAELSDSPFPHRMDCPMRKLYHG